MATQGYKHMGGRKRYVKQMLNIPASRVGIKEKTPSVSAKPKSKLSAFGTPITRAQLGLRNKPLKKGG